MPAKYALTGGLPNCSIFHVGPFQYDNMFKAGFMPPGDVKRQFLTF